LSQELVTYIVLGSESRLKNVKLPLDTKYEEYLLSNLSAESSYQNQLDDLVTSCKGELVVFLPPSSFPNSEAKESLKKIALIGLSSWGWFEYSLRRKNIIQNFKKVSTLVRSTPDIEQGIFFTKRLYFSIGGSGSFSSETFSELSKRLYSRIDPQKPLPALIIRTKNLKLN
jgi:hypothetical protein|tara:strand:- start:1450 stop:1962 length:513 start_codon:yes stop_codon:yes gene_type:complete